MFCNSKLVIRSCFFSLGLILLVFTAVSVSASDFQDTLKAAEQGDAYAQYNLGNMYRKGEGVLQDDKQAAMWFRKAAEQGLADAQNNLSQMYLKGRGVPQDDKQAAMWRRKAAERGHARAQFNLGNMYRKGEGVLQDYKQAYMWFSLARLNNYFVTWQIKEVSAYMTLNEINEAQAMGQLCFESNYTECNSGIASTRYAVVYAVQDKLNSLGLNVGIADGLYGRNTKSAITKYQQENGLSPTGSIDEDLKHHLNITEESLQDAEKKLEVIPSL